MIQAEYPAAVELRAKGKDDLVEMMELAFDYKRVPTVAELSEMMPGQSTFGYSMESFMVRDLMLKRGFVFPAKDLLEAWSSIMKGKKVVDLMCGTGWMSGWLRKYGVEVRSVDNKTWKFGRYETWVEKHDAVKFVKNNPADIYLCAWPYMNDTARRVWEAMRPGERMLYVGESEGGCTADSSFFSAVEGCEERVDLGPFYRFWGIHDEPTMYLKR